MSEETTPNVDEIKARLKEEERLKINVEDLDETNEQANSAANSAATSAAGQDIIDEMSNLGRQFAETVRNAWSSEERQKLETDIRNGINGFVTEVDKVFEEIKSSQVAQRAKQEASTVRETVQTGDIGRKTRTTAATGLRWLSEELGRLAEKFAPPETATPAPTADATPAPTATVDNGADDIVITVENDND
ncbi:MAG TPA: hypothetical protein VLL52_12450 [Anaerolineae bacterium]|nr:hypothetical protein [Anaerolineae bacterium]